MVAVELRAIGDGGSGLARPGRGSVPDAERPISKRRITREDVMTAGEVAAVLALPKSTVYELARRGELPCARLGRAVRFLRDDIEAILRDC
jgi:excisionase family DNA binding protein